MKIRRDQISNKLIGDFVFDIFGNEMHLKRVESLTNATIGVVQSLSLAIHIIGQGLSQAKDLSRKHCVKQVDRLLSNPKLDMDDVFQKWVPYITSKRKEIIISMDWTDFKHDNHSTIMLSMTTGHGRSTPLLWQTVDRKELKGNQNRYEDIALQKLHDYLPKGIKVTIVADRGFGDTKFFEFLTEQLSFHYIIRLKENIYITDQNGVQKKAKNWVVKGGKTKTINKAYITEQDYQVEKVVLTKKTGMKEAWILCVSDPEITGPQSIVIYGKRWGIETSFRDIKDYKFGMGMKHMHTKSTLRRDKLFLISALAIALLTLLGAAGDEAGLERTIKANTVKTRSYSFFSQGCIYFALLPGMRHQWFDPLIKKYIQLLNGHNQLKNILGVL
jgi:hypothetical protein